MSNLESPFSDILQEFERKSGLNGVHHELIPRPDGKILVLYVSNPTERLYQILEEARTNAALEGETPPLATLKRHKRESLLDGPEGRLLVRVLSESQNVNRYSFEKDFFSRYTRSVSGAEDLIISTANHIVLGRRGAGKSMLLLYAWHDRKTRQNPSVWIDMQVYANRGDIDVIADILVEILEQAAELLRETQELKELSSAIKTKNISLAELRKILPDIRRFLGRFAREGRELFMFIDDFHVVSKELQPKVLDVVYAIARGNKIYLKLSAIETLTRTYDPTTNTGMEVPQDAQSIRLDYNLTMPEKATAHIEAILSSHAKYAGLRSIRRLCTSGDVIPRLTWVAAGVPRDALNLFSQAISKATVEGRQRVTVSNVNVAASETIGGKLRELETDASDSAGELKELLSRIEAFCVEEKRKNAFLVQIGGDGELFDNVMNLVNLRLLHVISEGITVGKAGKKYVGLILDYGFYTGIRAAQSVDLFNRQSKRVNYKDLRVLQIFAS